MQPGSKAFRLSRLTQDQVDAGQLPVIIETAFLKKDKKSTTSASKKRKRTSASAAADAQEEDNSDVIDSELSELEEVKPPASKRGKAKDAKMATKKSKSQVDGPIEVLSDDEGGNVSWTPSGTEWQETIPYTQEIDRDCSVFTWRSGCLRWAAQWLFSPRKGEPRASPTFSLFGWHDVSVVGSRRCRLDCLLPQTTHHTPSSPHSFTTVTLLLKMVCAPVSFW